MDTQGRCSGDFCAHFPHLPALPGPQTHLRTLRGIEVSLMAAITPPWSK
jgi:hypothetical protein